MMRNHIKAIIHIAYGNLENSQSSVICISIFQEIVVDWIQNLKIASFLNNIEKTFKLRQKHAV